MHECTQLASTQVPSPQLASSATRLHEIPALDLVRRQDERFSVRVGCSVPPAEPAQEVGPGRRQQVVAGERARGVERVDQRSPASGPSAIATATARFSSTTGDGAMPRQFAVERRDLDPVGRRGVGAVAWHAAIAACTWYGPGCAAPQRGVEHRDALGDRVAVPPRAVLRLERARGRRQRRPGWTRRASCRSISASRPSASGSSGMSSVEGAGEADRFGAQLRPDRSAPAVAAYPSLNSRYSTASTRRVRSGSRCAGGTR